MIGVCIVTYNQEKFIEQCVESALSQKCDEPFRIYIGEDCSTDSTLDICQKYASKYTSVISLMHRNENYASCPLWQPPNPRKANNILIVNYCISTT